MGHCAEEKNIHALCLKSNIIFSGVWLLNSRGYVKICDNEYVMINDELLMAKYDRFLQLLPYRYSPSFFLTLSVPSGSS